MKTYKLKDETTGFSDPQTGLKVVRDEEVKIDTSKGTGEATMRAIQGGALIEVNRSSKSDDDESDLPPDFPTRKKLIDAGFDSVEKVRTASDEQLLDVVSQKSVENIRAATKG